MLPKVKSHKSTSAGAARCAWSMCLCQIKLFFFDPWKLTNLRVSKHHTITLHNLWLCIRGKYFGSSWWRCQWGRRASPRINDRDARHHRRRPCWEEPRPVRMRDHSFFITCRIVSGFFLYCECEYILDYGLLRRKKMIIRP